MAELAALSARSQVAAAFVEQATPDTGTLAAAEIARLTLFWFLPGRGGVRLRRLPAPCGARAARAARRVHRHAARTLGAGSRAAGARRHPPRPHVAAQQPVLARPISSRSGADAFVKGREHGPPERAASWLVAGVALLGAAICAVALVPAAPTGTNALPDALAPLRDLAGVLHGSREINALRALAGLLPAGRRRAYRARAGAAPSRPARCGCCSPPRSRPSRWAIRPARWPATIRRKPAPRCARRLPRPIPGAGSRSTICAGARTSTNDARACSDSSRRLPLARQRDLAAHFGIGKGFHHSTGRCSRPRRAFSTRFDVEILVVPFTALASFTANGRWKDTYSPAPGWQIGAAQPGPPRSRMGGVRGEPRGDAGGGARSALRAGLRSPHGGDPRGTSRARATRPRRPPRLRHQRA